MESDDGCYPITVLIEELRNEDIQLRLNSMRQLKTIALALGPEKTRSQLMSFLTDTIYDEDEVLYTAAEQLSTLVPYVGGREYAHSLIPPLEHLAIVEELAVRDKAVDVLRNLAPQLPTESIGKHFFPLVHRLATGHWYSSRSSACALISLTYPRVGESKRFELRELLKTLAVTVINGRYNQPVDEFQEFTSAITSDTTPMVRRAVAARLGEISLSMLGGPRAKKTDADPSGPQGGTGRADGERTSDESFRLSSGDVIGREAGTDRGEQPVETEQTMATDEMVEAVEAEEGKPTETTEVGSSEEDQRGDRCPSSLDGEQEVVPKLDAGAELNNIITFIRPMYTRLLLDEQESVRLMAMESVVSFIQALGPDEAENHFVELLQHMTSDTSWRLRFMLADKIIDMYQSLGNRLGRDYLTPVFIGLLKDNEVEVRVQAVNKLKLFTRCLLQLPVTSTTSNENTASNKLLRQRTSFEDESFRDQSENVPGVYAGEEQDGDTTTRPTDTSSPLLPQMSTAEMTDVWSRAAADKTIVYDLLPAVKILSTDVNSHLRSVLSSAVLGLAPLIGSELTMQHLLPVLLGFLKDDSPDVRLNLIPNLQQANCVIKMEHLYSTLLPTITKLASDAKWRVRLVIIEYMPLLADQLGPELFKRELTELCLKWLVDEVYAIREAAINNIMRLGTKFGGDWVNETFIPELNSLSCNESYLNRMICLQSIISLSETVSPEVCQQHLLPITLTMQTDSVPNIRFKVAQALSKLSPRVDQKLVMDGPVQTCLLRLLDDIDGDVRFYAFEAMDLLSLVPKEGAMSNAHVYVATGQLSTGESEEAAAAAAAVYVPCADSPPTPKLMTELDDDDDGDGDGDEEMLPLEEKIQDPVVVVGASSN